VLSGKAFTKSLFCLKSVAEALERLLVEVFFEENQISTSDTPEHFNNIALGCTSATLNGALADKSTTSLIQQYMDFQDSVRKGHLGKTAQFWMSFMDDANIVFMLLYAVKTHNQRLFQKCMGDMAILFFAYGGQNYSR